MLYQGEPGAFSEEAIFQFFVGEKAEGLESFDRVYERLLDDPLAAGLLPIENVYQGAVAEVWQGLINHEELSIWGEVVHEVHLALMAPPGETLDSIRRVRSHPQALMQSRGFWQSRELQAELALDTAGSAREVAENRWPGVAAIASPTAAAQFGLNILADQVQDYPDNRTRFWLISQRKPLLPDRIVVTMKASLALDMAHRPGALARVLNVFANRGIDLTKIESRPRPGTPFEFRFWADLTLLENKSKVLFESLEKVRSQVLFYRLLGYYPVFSR